MSLLCQQVGEDAAKFCGRLCFSGWLPFFFFFLVGLGVMQKERDGVAETIGGVLQNPVSFFYALPHKGLHSSVSIEVKSGSWTAFWGQWDI